MTLVYIAVRVRVLIQHPPVSDDGVPNLLWPARWLEAESVRLAPHPPLMLKE